MKKVLIDFVEYISNRYGMLNKKKLLKEVDLFIEQTPSIKKYNINKIGGDVAPNWFFINDRWYHCVAVIDGDMVKHYVDGKFTHQTPLSYYW